jgi:IclR family pca regulon transcriptional regulator
MGSKLTDSVQRAFTILEAFSPECPRMTLQQVEEKTELPRVTVFRYLRTLGSLGYVSQDSTSKSYFLTPKVLSLGFAMLASIELRDIALPYLEELSRATNQIVNLGIADKTEVVYIERIKRKQILNIDLYVGSRLSIYRTSIGLALLAFMDEASFSLLLKEIMQEPGAAKYVGPDGTRLLTALQEVRGKGYALNNEDLIPGLRAIAAPIFNGRGSVEAAVNMPVFSIEVSLKELTERHLPLLLNTAAKISAALGCTAGAPLQRHNR